MHGLNATSTDHISSDLMCFPPLVATLGADKAPSGSIVLFTTLRKCWSVYASWLGRPLYRGNHSTSCGLPQSCPPRHIKIQCLGRPKHQKYKQHKRESGFHIWQPKQQSNRQISYTHTSQRICFSFLLTHTQRFFQSSDPSQALGLSSPSVDRPHIGLVSIFFNSLVVSSYCGVQDWDIKHKSYYRILQTKTLKS